MAKWLATGIGNGLIDQANFLEKQALQENESRLMMERAAMLEEFKQRNMDREQAIKDAPYNRANAAIRAAQAKEVPVAAEDVRSLSGDESAGREGGLHGAYQGDVQNIVKDISKIKNDDEKRQAAEALELQLQDAKAKNEGMVAGKTRKLTDEEVMAEARRALIGDIQAGKALREGEREKFTRIGKDDTLIDGQGRVVYRNDAGTEQLQQRMENRLEIEKMRGELRAQLAASGASHTQLTAFERNFDKIRREMPHLSAREILDELNRAKSPGDSYSQTEETDPLTGEKKTKTVRKGSGQPPGPSPEKLDALFPPKR